MKQHDRFMPAAVFLLLGTLCLNSSSWGDAKDGHDHNAQGVIGIDVCAQGRHVHLLVAACKPDQPPALHYLRSEDGGASWSEPVDIPVAHATPAGIQRGNDPSLAVRDNRVMALWTARGGGPFGSGPIGVSLSDDGGATWQAGPAPVVNVADAGYRFPAAAVDARGFHGVWIHAAGEERSLRYARLGFGEERWSEPMMLDPRICACCWNKLQVADDGALFALYRDQEPSDMAMTVSRDGGKNWQTAGHVGRFDWRFDGCPHVGGGLSLVQRKDGLTCHAVVWTAKGKETHGAYYLNSADGGQTWSEPRQLGDSRSWHPDVAANDKGEVAAVWDAYTEDGQIIFAATSKDGGKSWSAPQRLNEKGAAATHPRIIHTPTGFRAFWTQKTEGKAAAWATRELESPHAE